MSPSKTSVCTAALSLFPFLASLVVPVITTPTPINGTYPITNGTTNGTSQCRCFPGDSCWPSQSAWSQLNSSVSGRLVASAPLASVCHDPSFSSAECDSLTENWFLSQTHYPSSSSVMAPYFAGNSCDPFGPQSLPCTLGNYINYAIDIKEPSDIAAGIEFATKNNIRLVIRNTGHDYNGKSTGAGALGLWTHHLKNIDFLDWDSETYKGKAVKLGAGTQGFEALKATHDAGFTVVGGECPTTGIAGGYSQGGGHSPQASKYGMAADQVLEWEVVTGEGKFVKASRTENQDLYWALSGGGGGTYGVVYAMTSKAHPNIPTTGTNLTFSSEGISKDTYYAAVAAWHATLPDLVDAGGTCEWFVSPDSFLLTPFSGPGMTVEQATKLMQPMVDALKNLNISYELTGPILFPSYQDMFDVFVGELEIATSQYGGRMIPRKVVEEKPDDVVAVIRNIIEDSTTPTSFFGVGLNVNKSIERGNDNVDNALFPVWRETLISAVIITPWNSTAPVSEMVDLQKLMTEKYIPQLEAITPGSGCYLSESDPFQPNWQETFYGTNYQRLDSIKSKYDPNDIFYALGAVGSDRWAAEIGGPLCKQ